MTNVTIGVDVSKDHLDAHRLPDGAAKRFTNDAAGHRALIRWLKPLTVDRIVFEATGRYTHKLELALTAAALPAVKLNPARARRFAEAIGTLAKTMLSMEPCWPAWARPWNCRRSPCKEKT